MRAKSDLLPSCLSLCDFPRVRHSGFVDLPFWVVTKPVPVMSAH